MMPSLPYDTILYEDLRDPKYAAGYLTECLKDPDPQVFLLAIKKVMTASGASQSEIAEVTGLHPVSVSRMLSEKGNPELRNILSILRSIGLDFQVKPIPKRKSKNQQTA
jgi:probable addiction module antidote protein